MKFLVKDLFTLVNNPQLDKKYFTFDKNATFPYFTRTENNNGILGYVEYLDEQHKIQGNSLAVGMISMKFHYMKSDFYAGQFTKTAIPKFKKFNERIALYFIGILNKKSEYYKSLLIRDFEDAFLNTKLELPSCDGINPDYDSIENHIRELEQQYIKELEQERVNELDKYLKTTRLNNFILTENDKNILNNDVNFKEFKITDIFKVINTHSILKEDVVFNSGNTPYATASEGNNSIVSYIQATQSIIDKGNCVLIGGKTMVVTYQEQDFVSNDSHNLALYLIDEKYQNKSIYLYMVCAIYKSLGTKYHWGDSISKKKIQNDVVMLPVDTDGDIYYSYMEQYIKVIEKLTIKDVVEYKDKVINLTRKVCNN